MKIKLKNVRIAFAQNLFNGKPNESGNLKYSATFLYDKDGEVSKQLDEAIDSQGVAAFDKTWPSVKKGLVVKDKCIKHNGDDKDYDGFAGMGYVIAYSDRRPDVRDRAAAPVTEADDVVYSGCYVDVILDISVYNHKVYKAVAAVSLLGVQLRADGERLGAAKPKANDDDYEAITGSDADDL